MERTITVRGTGKLSIAPDLITIMLTIRKKDKDYETAMRGSAQLQEALRSALSEVGFGRDDLKTSSFDVHTEYESVREERGQFRQVFAGYVCEHQLKLEFGFDTERLPLVLGAISRCIAEPELYISFSVKDRESASDALLESAAGNARAKAELLAASSNVGLGRLLSVVYDWRDLSFVSPTRYAGAAKMRGAANEECASLDMGISPENVSLSDSAVFVWEIV